MMWIYYVSLLYSLLETEDVIESLKKALMVN